MHQEISSLILKSTQIEQNVFFMLGNMYFLMMKNVFLMKGKDSIFCCSQKLNPSQQNLQSTAFNCSWNSIEQQTLIQRGGALFSIVMTLFALLIKYHFQVNTLHTDFPIFVCRWNSYRSPETAKYRAISTCWIFAKLKREH